MDLERHSYLEMGEGSIWSGEYEIFRVVWR